MTNHKENAWRPGCGTAPYVKKLEKQDAMAMHALEQACFSTPWSLAQCRAALHNPAFMAFGIWRSRTLLAYISAYHINGELEILNLGVMPAERRRGLAQILLHGLLQAGNKMGMQKTVLEVRESNFAAIALYHKFGFRPAGMRPRYYPDNGENALIFERV